MTTLSPINIIIPAYNEERSIAHVIKSVPAGVDEIIVVNNGSTDATEEAAKRAGATVLKEEKRGYGYACLRAIEYIDAKARKPAIVVFIDGDYSDYPEELPRLLQPIIEEGYDLVIGARKKEWREKHAMTPQQVVGNALATFLMKLFFKAQFSDLGPFRAIRYEALKKLGMVDKTYGWTVEMQLKAHRKKLSYTEVPVHYRKRIGMSKVSGTIKGTIFASIKIIGWILKYTLRL